MKRPTPFPSDTAESLQSLLKNAKTKLEYQRVLCIWLRAAFHCYSSQIAHAIGWHQSTVKKLHAEYLKHGESVLKIKGRGGRYRENMSYEEEKGILSSFLKRSQDGGILVVSEIKSIYERKIGHAVPKSTIYRMLSRHGWRKIAPGHRHPKVDEKAQEEFKKN